MNHYNLHASCILSIIWFLSRFGFPLEHSIPLFFALSGFVYCIVPNQVEDVQHESNETIMLRTQVRSMHWRILLNKASSSAILKRALKQLSESNINRYSRDQCEIPPHKWSSKSGFMKTSNPTRNPIRRCSTDYSL